MSWTYAQDDSDLSDWRLLTGDVHGDAPIWTDAEAARFLALEADLGVKGAAALALERLAIDKGRIAVVLGRLGLTEDLSKIAGEIRKSASELRAQAKAEAATGVMAVFTSPSWTAFALDRNEVLSGTTVTNYAQQKAIP